MTPLAAVPNLHHILMAHEKKRLFCGLLGMIMKLETSPAHAVHFHHFIDMGIKRFKELVEFFKFRPIDVVNVGI